MKLPGLRSSDRTTSLRHVAEDAYDAGSEIEEPLPPVTRHELLVRLGVDESAESSAISASARMPDAEAIAAA
ncbi:MAG: hypothetical protein QOH61_2016 [Chloroflexota bacterium]|jgi:hypothetical protein|nr:hypothetical protein [Chloroflexota bacterium]